MNLREIVDYQQFRCHRCNAPILHKDIHIIDQPDAHTFTIVFEHHEAREQVILPHLRAGGLSDARALGAFIATIKPFSTVAAPKGVPQKSVQSGQRLIRFED